MSLVAEGRMHQFLMNLWCSERAGIDTMSSGSMSTDLGDMWRQGNLVSPQWEGELELDSAIDYDNVDEEVDSVEARDHAAESGPKDYFSVARESLLWILFSCFRHSVSPPDVLILRTGVRSSNKAIFLMTVKWRSVSYSCKEYTS